MRPGAECSDIWNAHVGRGQVDQNTVITCAPVIWQLVSNLADRANTQSYVDGYDNFGPGRFFALRRYFYVERCNLHGSAFGK